MVSRSVYFDYNATAPLDPQVRAAMLPFLDGIFGNPSSVHRVGQQARLALDEARDRVAGVWRCKPSEVVFTSGGTESDNMAIFGAARHLKPRGSHLITSAIEHHAVLNCFQSLAAREGFELTILPVTAEGRVTVESLAHAIRPDTSLVSIMAANNETGALQPVAELGALCRERGVLFHTDAVQWFGKEPVESIHQFNADLVSFCAHKAYGPKGIGALFVKSGTVLEPLIHGGGHENERRAGTENLAAIAGLAEVMDRFVRVPVFPKERLIVLTEGFRSALARLPGVRVVTPTSQRLSNTVTITIQICSSATVLAGLDLKGVCASSGSACTSGSVQPSHVLNAMGIKAEAVVRFSLGRESTQEEVDKAVGALAAVINRIIEVQ
jgi:cysteine desulfurase